LLLIRLTEAQCDALRAKLARRPGGRFQIDLQAQRLADCEGETLGFEIEEARKKRLLLGLDEIGLTLQYESQITTFEERFRAERPWLFTAS
jgi:3-isopropylmalate/(R)-2-methylmalate dehydratase small subunit